MMSRAWWASALLILTACGGGSGEDEYVDRMAEEHKDDTPIASPAAREETIADILTENVAYAANDSGEIIGYLARPAQPESSGAILLIHEWWGLNDNIRAMARKLAAEGYLALAVDLYDGQSAEDRDGARALMSQAMDAPEAAEDNLQQAYGYLQEQGAIHIASIGWCFGGGWSLRTALLYPQDLDAAVIYYGRLVTEREQLETLNVPILGIFGALDQGIPLATVREFESALQDLGKTATIEVYEEADHAFANPSGTRYNPAAAEDAWTKTLSFLEQHLGG